MAVKIQFRRGNAAAVPSLDIGEPGYDIDVKTLRVGDGTSTPPRVPTTKSVGSFDFSSVTDFRIPRVIFGLGSATAVSIFFNAADQDTGIFSPGTGQVAMASNGTTRLLIDTVGATITGNLTVTGTVDGVDISQLNPSGLHGLLTKTANNAYTVRSLVPGVGIAPFKNTSGAANPGGVVGDIVVQIADNPTLPGVAAVKVPAGTTGERAGVTPVNGHFRYNSTKRSFEGYIDGEWREIVDYVEGKVVQVPSQFATIQDAIDYFNNRSTKASVFIQLAAGAQPISATVTPGSRTNRVIIQGQAPVTVALDASTPVVSVTGAAGNWAVTYKLSTAIPAGLVSGPSGHTMIIDDIEASGDGPWGKNFSGKSHGVGINSGNLAQIQINSVKDSSNTVIPISKYYAVNDYVMATGAGSAPEVKRVTTLTSTLVATVDSTFATRSGIGQVHRKLRRLTGTISASNSTTITGSGTAFTTQLNVGDHIITADQMQIVRVATIVSNTSFTTDYAVTIAGSTVALQVCNSSSHKGAWHVSAIDTVNRTVTVTNTSRSPVPPIINGLRRGTVVFMPSTVLFTPSVAFNLLENEFLGLKNLTLRYTGGSPTSSIYAINSSKGVVTCDNVGISNGMVVMRRQSTLDFTQLFVCGIQAGNTAIIAESSSVLNGDLLCASGSNGQGLQAVSAQLAISVFLGCGNQATAFRAQGNTTASISWFKCSQNIGFAYAASALDRMNISVAECMHNGVYDPAGTADDSFSPQFQIRQGSAVNIGAADCSLVLTSRSAAFDVRHCSQLYFRKGLVGPSASHNVYLENQSMLWLGGAVLHNSQSTNVLATIMSVVRLDGHYERLNHGRGHGIHVRHMSFLDTGDKAWVKRGPLAASNMRDILAEFASNVYTYKTHGSGGSNALICSPAVNDKPGNYNSQIYGTKL